MITSFTTFYARCDRCQIDGPFVVNHSPPPVSDSTPAQAKQLALEAGWSEHETRTANLGTAYHQLLCPSCSRKEPSSAVGSANDPG